MCRRHRPLATTRHRLGILLRPLHLTVLLALTSFSLIFALALRPALAAAGARAILLVWDSGSGDKSVVASHQAMVEELKKLRAQGILAKVSDLEQSIKVYDFALPNHAEALRSLGFKHGEVPAIAAVQVNSEGLPARVLYVSRYARPSEGLSGLGHFLGAKLEASSAGPRGQEERRVVFLTDGQEGANGKLQEYVAAHFKDLAGVGDLARKAYTYSFSKDDHRAFLEKLGLERSKAPYLTVIRFVGETPRDVLWSAPVVDAEVSWQAMCDYLGLKTGVTIDKAIFLVGQPAKEQAPTFYEVQGKITAILAERPPRGVQPQLRVVSSLGLSVPSPSLVLARLDNAGNPQQALFSDGAFASAEVTLDGLYKSLGQVYQAPVEYTNPKDGSVLRRVAGGIYNIGSNDGEDNEKPVHRVEMGPYYIGKYEVTNEQFARFVQATGYQTAAERQGGSYVPPQRDRPMPGANWRHPTGSSSNSLPRAPVVHVTHDDALAYATWAGLSLPYEEQWEWAAIGPDQRLYPWGSQFEASLCRGSVGRGFAGAEGFAQVGSYPKDQSSWGCLDMAGNVAEWMGNYYKVYPGSAASKEKCTELYVTVRGGSWANEQPNEFRGAKRLPYPRVFSSSTLGFRVARTERRRLTGP